MVEQACGDTRGVTMAHILSALETPIVTTTSCSKINNTLQQALLKSPTSCGCTLSTASKSAASRRGAGGSAGGSSVWHPSQSVAQPFEYRPVGSLSASVRHEPKHLKQVGQDHYVNEDGTNAFVKRAMCDIDKAVSKEEDAAPQKETTTNAIVRSVRPSTNKSIKHEIEPLAVSAKSFSINHPGSGSGR